MGGGASSSKRSGSSAQYKAEGEEQNTSNPARDTEAVADLLSPHRRVPKAVDAAPRTKIEDLVSSPVHQQHRPEQKWEHNAIQGQHPQRPQPQHSEHHQQMHQSGAPVTVRAATGSPGRGGVASIRHVPSDPQGFVTTPSTLRPQRPAPAHPRITNASARQSPFAASVATAAVPQAAASNEINSTSVTPERAVSQRAALAAVRGACVTSPQGQRSGEQSVHFLTAHRPIAAQTSACLGDLLQQQHQEQQFKVFHVEVTPRKLMVHWVRLARQRVREIEAMRPHSAVTPCSDGLEVQRTKKRKVAARVDRLVGMYLDNQEELERLCLEEPTLLLTNQIDLLTRRINTLTEGGKTGGSKAAGLISPETLDRKTAAHNQMQVGAAGSKAAGASKDQRRAKGQTKAQERQGSQGKDEAQQREPTATGVILSWEDAFDRAMKTREDWKKSRDKAQRDARRPLLWDKQEARNTAKKKEEGVDHLIIAQLRAEREKLAEVMLTFESRVRKRQDQAALDLAESMTEARRQAYARRDEEIRRRHQKEEEEQRRREERKRKLEEEERRKQEELARLREEEAQREREREEAWRQKLKEQEQMSWMKREEEHKKKTLEFQKVAEMRRAAEAAARAAAEERVREEEAIRAEKEKARVASAFDGLEEACDRVDDAAEATRKLTHQRDEGESAVGGPSGPQGPDWMARALEALEEDDSDDDSTWRGAHYLNDEADVELAHLSEAIAMRINQLHRLEPRGSCDSISGEPL